jgi:hypothetical protein
MENALIERLKKLTGPDQEADEALYVFETPRMADILPHWTREQRADLVIHYTASIDEAVGLVERTLKWSWRVGNTPSGRGFAYLGTSQQEHEGATPAIALCIAALLALAPRERIER